MSLRRLPPSRPSTIPARIEAAAAARPHGKVTFINGELAVGVTYAELIDDARAMAAALQVRGVGPGSHVGILGPTTRHLVTSLEAVWLCGATVMVLPLPMRLSSIDEFVRQTRVRLLAGDVSLLLIDSQLAEFYTAEPGDPPSLALDTLAAAATSIGSSSWVRPKVDADSLAILQFTSGSTSDPKGVMLPHRAVCANLDAIASATDLDVDDDVLVSWLPLYHDMGLVGKLGTTLTSGTDLVLAAPQDFLASPARWMHWMSTYRGTASAAPNFAYALATRALKRLDGLDLSRWRIALNGAEPVDPATVEAFVEAGARHGLRPGAIFPAFGMAEVSIAGAFPPHGRGLVTDCVDRRVLETERYAAPAEPGAKGTRALPLLGKPVDGLEMRVCDPESGIELLEREAGELEVRGTSLTTGYYRHDEANRANFREGGWFRTGDLAYFVDGELVICGRIKDLIIVGGRNVFPEDIERAVAEIDGIRKGNVIAFAVTGRRKEQVVLVAESSADDLELVRKHVAEVVREVAGVPAGDIVLVEPGTMPKTSSGKLQRSLCRTRYLSAELVPRIPESVS